MNDITICHFYFLKIFRIIAFVDEGHHLNALENTSTARASQPTRCTYLVKQMREKVLIHLLRNNLFIIRSILGKTT
jgi:hypothetical protein